MSSKATKKKPDSTPASPVPAKKPRRVELIVRPSATGPAKCAHVYVAVDTLRQAGLDAGQFVALGNGIRAIVTPVDCDPDIVQVPIELRQLAGMCLGDRLTLVKAVRPPVATSVSVLGSDEALLRQVGLVHTSLCTGTIRVVDIQTGEPPDVQRLSLDAPALDSSAIEGALITANTKIITKNTGSTEELRPVDYYAQIGGLAKELDMLRSKIELPLRRPDLFSRFRTAPERGFLLHGPPGTGKTMLLKAVAGSNSDVHILRLNGPAIYSKYLGETEGALRSVFEEAGRFAPAVIFVDEIDALAPRRDSDEAGETESRVVATLLTLMDGMDQDRRIVVLGATNRPNRLDPALRRPGRFGVEIEIGIPDAKGRQSILEVLLHAVPHQLKPIDITDLAARTHGYVGADLQSLLREGVLRAIEAGLALNLESSEMFLRREHLEQALIAIRPSAMREIFLETPTVRWADIGGQSSTIQRLRETVEWPFSHADAFERLGITAPRGVLLYGPPGCSKTLLAKALATETGLNFLAVKGPELFNKYVGESERAVREIFRKARQAAPSIIFFDEIDALSVARGDADAGAGGDRVLTSLLNEMDGIESLKGVVVLAATNRPDVIDPALLRPGRLDRLIYVSPPDVTARRQILLIQFASMAVDEFVNLDELAALTDGFSGAEIVAVCREAGLLAMNENIDVPAIRQDHFEAAIAGIHRQITPQMLAYFTRFATGQL